MDNFDTLSFDENNNNKEKSKETGSTEDNKPEQEDMDSRILNEMLLNDSKSIPDEAHTEDDNIDKADDNVNETGKDFSKDNTDETSVEDMLKQFRIILMNRIMMNWLIFLHWMME